MYLLVLRQGDLVDEEGAADAHGAHERAVGPLKDAVPAVDGECTMV